MALAIPSGGSTGSFPHLKRKKYSSSAQNNMKAGIRLNHFTQFVDLQRVRRFFERLLHLTAAEVAEVAAFLGRTTVAFGRRQFGKTDLATSYPGTVP